MVVRMNRFALITILVMINILCIGLTMTMTQWLARVPVITKTDVQLFLILLVTSGIVCMALVLAGVVKLEPNGQHTEGRFYYVSYIGLYLFGIGAIILNVLEFAACIQCTVDANAKQSINLQDLEYITYQNVVFAILNVFKSFSIIIQLSFLVRFKRHKAVSRLSKLCVMSTLAANASLYIFTFLQETMEKFHVKDQEHCINETTSLQNTLDIAEPYLYPFDMEFCLVAAGMLINMLITSSHTVAAPQPTGTAGRYAAANDSGVHTDQPTSSDNSASNHQAPANMEGDDAPLITSADSDLRHDEMLPVANGERRNRRAVQVVEMQPCVFAFNLAIVCSIILIILEALCYDEDLRQQLEVSFYSVRLIYYCVFLAATVGGVNIMGNKLSQQGMRLHPETILLLVAATGEFIYLYFGLLASTAVFDPNVSKKMLNLTSTAPEKDSTQSIVDVSWISLFTNATDIFQIACQSFLLILAEGRYGTGTRWSANDSKRKYILKEILWYLCVCNFFKWATDSFVEGHFLKASEAKTLVFGEATWTGITQSTYPLVLFYRFHSVHMILGTMDTIF